MSLAGASSAAFEQVGLLGGIGGAVGVALSSKVGPTELPQTVAAFHSLGKYLCVYFLPCSFSHFLLLFPVGIAAMAGAAGEFLGNVGELDVGTLSAIYLAVFIGGITFTGSVVAFSKLAGMLSSKALALPARDQLNLCMLGVLALGMTSFLDPSLGNTLGMNNLDPETIQMASLSLAAFVSSVLGFHLVASIGGPDMPVVITVLNSYSGWALVAGKSHAN
jgi:NAD(P) transhydrogenase